MTTTTAYAAPAAKAPLERTTIERRPVGEHDVLIDIEFAGICHSDIHQAREEWGDGDLPDGARPRDRRHRRRGRRRGHEVRRSATGSASAAWSTPAASARTAGPAWSSTASKATVGTYNAIGKDGQPTYGGYSHAHRRRRELRRCASPTASTLDVAAPLLCAGITTYSPLRHWKRRPGQEGRDRRPRRPRPHGREDRARAWAPRSPCCRQSLRKKDDGLRLGADHYYATSDPATFDDARRQLRPDHQHRLAQPLDSTPTCRCCARRHPGQRRRAARAARASRCSSLLGERRSWPARCIGGIARDPGDARLLRRARHRRRDRDDPRASRSTRPTSGSSAATSATGSSSTSPRSDPPHPHRRHGAGEPKASALGPGRRPLRSVTA